MLISFWILKITDDEVWIKISALLGIIAAASAVLKIISMANKEIKYSIKRSKIKISNSLIHSTTSENKVSQ